jgi:hypothetical protein
VVTLLSQIFLRTGRLPAEIWDQPPAARVLCLVTMRLTLEQEQEQAYALRAQAARSAGRSAVRLPRRR